MADLFTILDAPTAASEGGYVNNPNDPGGETMRGITVGVARENGYLGRMIDMTAAQAAAIRRAKYYAKPGIYFIAPISEKVASEVYDTGVLMGTGTAVMWLQRALSALNRQEKDYPDVKVDGAIGPATAAALRTFLIVRGEPDVSTVVMLSMLTAMQDADFLAIAERRHASEDFLYGWLRARGRFPT